MSFHPDKITEIFKAIRFAAEKHRDDRRKGPIAAPYINHPIIVAEQLAAVGLGDNPEVLMAAVLHDVVEDTNATEEELRITFGDRVAGIVMEVTDEEGLSRREAKVKVVNKIAGKSLEARLVKLSDLIANSYDVIYHPPNWSDKQKLGYLEWAQAVADKLRGTHPELEARLHTLLADARNRLAG